MIVEFEFQVKEREVNPVQMLTTEVPLLSAKRSNITNLNSLTFGFNSAELPKVRQLKKHNSTKY